MNTLNIKECLNTPLITNNNKSVNIAGVIIGNNPQVFNTKVILGDHQEICSDNQFVALTNTNQEIGDWDIVDLNASIISIFAGLAINNCIYFGNNNIFAGFNYTAILVFAGLSNLTSWEYWNGANWTSLCIMDNRAIEPFTQYANTPFERFINVPESLRIENISQNWYKKELNGLNKFWIRICVTMLLPVIPTIKDFSFFNNHKTISNKGQSLYFGSSTLKRELVFDRKLLEVVNSQPPTLRDLNLTPTFVIDANFNSFVHTTEESIGGVFRIPFGTDTSAKLTVILAWFPFTGLPNLRTGEIQWNIEYVPIKVGDNMTNQSLISGTLSKRVRVDKPNNTNILYITEFEIPIQTLKPFEMLGIRLYRDAPNSGITDLFESNINLVDLSTCIRLFK